jgi:hypothetical protein
MVGLLGLLANGIDIARAFSDREEFAKKTREDFDTMAERSNAPELREWGEVTVTWWPVARLVFVSISLLNAAAGLAMIRHRFHSLAMLGSVAALFNVSNCCCVFGFPAGAWALFVLMNPEVRALFDKPKASPDASGLA